uniref:PITH domain-containing protein n=1 Tax=Guillardia theta TaxID=55529 RepID=A0A7S4PAX8_GUITH
MEDLYDHVERKQCDCLNGDESFPLSNAIDREAREDDEKFLKSDCDAQLLLHIAFQQIVKIHSIVIYTCQKHRAVGPKKIALFVNKPHLDFSSCESEKTSQEMELTDDLLDGRPLELKFTSFQNVSSLSILVKGNMSGDEDEPTIISKLSFLGFTTNIEGRKRTLEEQKAASAGDWLNPK